MSYYSFMTREWKKVYWIYGFEIDFDIIERIDNEKEFFITRDDYGGWDRDEERLSDVTERVTDFLRREFDCIGPMLSWNPDSPTKERTYVLAVHAHATPKTTKDKEMIMRRIARLKKELMPDVKAKAKWYFSCGAGVFKGDVDWSSRPESFFAHRRLRSDTKNVKQV